jgi:hypothetical protein
MGNKIEYIPLETNPMSLLFRVEKIVICEPYIFLMDLRTPLLFTMDGSFVRQIGTRGNGPGEYRAEIWDICINESLRQLIVLEFFGTHIFDFDGKHLKQPLKRKIVFDRVFPWEENQLIYYYRNVPKYKDSTVYSLVILNDEGEIVNSFKNHHKRVQQPGISVSGYAPFYLFQNKIRFKEFGVDTLYTVEKNQLVPHAIFYLGDSEMPTDINTDSEDILVYSKRNPEKFWINDIIEDNNNFYTTLYQCESINAFGTLKGRLLKGVCSKVTRKTKFLDNNGFQNDIDGGLPFFPQYVYDDNVLVDWVNALDLRKHVLNCNAAEMRKLYGQKFDDLLKLVNTLQDDSNPVLLVVKQ